MAMISASDFRNGVTFEMDGKVMQVIEFQHVKPGKGAAFVRTKMKNIITGGVTETSFNPTAKFEQAFVERKDMEAMAALKVNICMECGCCSFICPASRPLVQTNKLAKPMVMAYLKEKQEKEAAKK